MIYFLKISFYERIIIWSISNNWKSSKLIYLEKKPIYIEQSRFLIVISVWKIVNLEVNLI